MARAEVRRLQFHDSESVSACRAGHGGLVPRWVANGMRIDHGILHLDRGNEDLNALSEGESSQAREGFELY
jgi:hypothetical protein